MDSIGNIFNTLGKSISSNPLAAIGAGGGLLSNILANRKAGQVTDAELARQKYLNKVAGDPSILNNLVAKYQQPLSSNLTNSVGNEVQGALAEKGLSASPGITAEVLAQALAPYQERQQQMAIGEAESALGAGSGGVPSHVPQPLDLSKLLSFLVKPNQPQNPNPVYQEPGSQDPLSETTPTWGYPGYGSGSGLPDLSTYPTGDTGLPQQPGF